MLRSVLLVSCLVTPVRAEDWLVLDAALAARVLRYENGSTQNFVTDGPTLYEAGRRESWGKWWVEGGQYCSAWPPSDVAACYRVEAQGLDVRITGKGGNVSVGGIRI
jgi:hypothetical protein